MRKTRWRSSGEAGAEETLPLTTFFLFSSSSYSSGLQLTTLRVLLPQSNTLATRKCCIRLYRPPGSRESDDTQSPGVKDAFFFVFLLKRSVSIKNGNQK